MISDQCFRPVVPIATVKKKKPVKNACRLAFHLKYSARFSLIRLDT
jgi:hypothetical protein